MPQRPRVRGFQPVLAHLADPDPRAQDVQSLETWKLVRREIDRWPNKMGFPPYGRARFPAEIRQLFWKLCGRFQWELRALAAVSRFAQDCAVVPLAKEPVRPEAERFLNPGAGHSIQSGLPGENHGVDRFDRKIRMRV